jgi:hypothetical protein
MTKIKKTKRFQVRKLKTYVNPDGNAVPQEYMTDINMLKEYVAVTLGAEAEALQIRLLQFREKSIKMLEWYKERSAALRDIKPREGKGYITCTAFSATYRAEINNYPYIKFSEGFQQAKELMGQVIHDQLGEKNILKQIFDDAFSINKEGVVKISSIMRLMEYKVDDERWQKAKQILLEDMQVLRRRQFPSFSKRNGGDGKFEPIVLDISRI